MNESTENYYTGREFEESKDVYEDKSKDLDWNECAQRFLRNKYMIKDIEKEQDFLRNQLIFLAKDKASHGAGIMLEKSEIKGHIDYSMVPELLGVDMELYRKKTTTRWRITEI